MDELMCRMPTAGGNNAEGQTATTHGETCASPRQRMHENGNKQHHHQHYSWSNGCGSISVSVNSFGVSLTHTNTLHARVPSSWCWNEPAAEGCRVFIENVQDRKMSDRRFCKAEMSAPNNIFLN